MPIVSAGVNEDIAHSIRSTTIVPSPSDTQRTKLGVGELVMLELVPSHNATWTISGGGKINNSTQNVSGTSVVLFEAPADPGSATITATCAVDQKVASITFTTVKPTGLKFSFKQHISSNGIPLEISYLAEVAVLPADVNFQKISIYEDEADATLSGFFTRYAGDSAITKHPKGSPVALTSHVEGRGTIMANPDTISAGTALGNSPTTEYKKYTGGSFEWDIPTKYIINGIDKGKFANGLFKAKITVDASTAIATLSTEKNGEAKASINEDGVKTP
ncbi:MAG: hypothetical protein V4733_08455 [Verrucomicrobiota bacterium]